MLTNNTRGMKRKKNSKIKPKKIDSKKCDGGPQTSEGLQNVLSSGCFLADR